MGGAKKIRGGLKNPREVWRFWEASVPESPYFYAYDIQ